MRSVNHRLCLDRAVVLAYAVLTGLVLGSTLLAESDRNWLVSLRFAFHKVVLVAGGMLAGLSIGHEGPMVQVGTDVIGRA